MGQARHTLDALRSAHNVPKRTVTVIFPCENCEIKKKSLKFCMRHGHEDSMQKALVEEDDPDSLGDETIHHDVYEKIHPDANVRPNQVLCWVRVCRRGRWNFGHVDTSIDENTSRSKRLFRAWCRPRRTKEEAERGMRTRTLSTTWQSPPAMMLRCVLWGAKRKGNETGSLKRSRLPCCSISHDLTEWET